MKDRQIAAWCIVKCVKEIALKIPYITITVPTILYHVAILPNLSKKIKEGKLKVTKA